MRFESSVAASLNLTSFCDDDEVISITSRLASLTMISLILGSSKKSSEALVVSAKSTKSSSLNLALHSALKLEKKCN